MEPEIGQRVLEPAGANSRDEIPFLKNIALMQTFKCNIACPHCLMEAGPHRHEEMSREDSTRWLDQAREYRDGIIQGLALTGGEPFGNEDLLQKVSTYGARKGFTVSAVTNGFWATSEEKAIATLRKLPAVRLLCISADEFHQKFIPMENIRNAVTAAEQLGIVYSLAICTPHFEDRKFLEILAQALDITQGDRGKIRLSVTFPVGRAEKRARNFNYEMTGQPPAGACQMACSPVVFPDGTVMGCIGPLVNLKTSHPLLLGNLFQDSLATLLDRAEHNTALHCIRVWGPHKLLAAIARHWPDAPLPGRFIHDCNCDVCYRLFKDEKLLAMIEEIQEKDEELRDLVAYGRLYYLNEPQMLTDAGLV